MMTNNEQANDWQKDNVNNTKHLAKWTMIWLITLAVATFGSQLIWHQQTWLIAVSVFVNLLAGIMMIFANKKHLQGLDEMQQRIQLNAMAITLGIALVFGLSYSTLEVVHLIDFQAEISHLVMLMGITYLVSVVAGVKYYS